MVDSCGACSKVKAYFIDGVIGESVLLDHLRKLKALADTQKGYFTARQAVGLGFSKHLQAYHCKTGNWEKHGHGLFRLAGYPDSMEADFVRCSFWSRNSRQQPQGVISYASALAFHGLEEYDSSLIHMTVPSAFRKKTPEGIQVHKGALNLSAIESRDLFMVTRPGQTLQDMKQELLAENKWESVVAQALEAGMLNQQEMNAIGLDGGVASTRQENSKMPVMAKATDGMEYRQEGVWQMIYRNTTRGKRRKAGFTLVELLVVIAIISILAGMLLPALSQAMNSAYLVECLNKQKQLGLAVTSYTDQNVDTFPPVAMPSVGTGYCWTRLLMPEFGLGAYGTSEGFSDLKTTVIFKCSRDNVERGDTGPAICSYGFNFEVQKGDLTGATPPVKISRVAQPSRTILFGDRWYDANTVNHSIGLDAVRAGDFHEEGSNYLMADMHTEKLYLLETRDNSNFLWKFQK